MTARDRIVYLECTTTFRHDQGTGIPRVVRNVVRHFRALAPARGFTAVPVYFEDGYFYRAPIDADGRLQSLLEGNDSETLHRRAQRRINRFARALPQGPVRRFLSAPATAPGLANIVRSVVSGAQRLRASGSIGDGGERVHIRPQDVLFHIDLTAGIDMRPALRALRAQGTFICAIINDVIPLRFVDIWPAEFVAPFRDWAECMIGNADCIFTISQASKADIEHVRQQMPEGSYPAGQVVEWFHLGHDMDLLDERAAPRARLRDVFDSGVPVLLNVGWLDPRKNQRRLIVALAELRRRGVRAKLLLVGKRGLGADAVFDDIRAHPRVRSDIHVFHGLSDAELRFAFVNARALVYPSYAEGFGLPLVEALMHRLPVFASDIRVFREIAGAYAVYFDPFDAMSIADVLEAFLVRGEYPPSRLREPFAWISWEDCVAHLIDLLQQRLPHMVAA